MIYLEKVYLSNWFGFTDEMIPFSKYNTFITGENESGKSTILDAIKYAFMADTQFNKGAETKGEKKRTLASYTRCLFNPSEGKYLRTEDKIYSYVFLGWHDDKTGEHFTTGCIILTYKDNTTSTTWYILEKPISQISFLTEVEGKKYFLTPKDFKKLNSDCETQTFGSWEEAKTEFMYRLGLPMSPNEFNKYRDEMRHMVTYRTNMKMVDFVKEFVLKENIIDIDNLIDSKKQFDSLKSKMDVLMAEASQLEKVQESFNKYLDLTKKQNINNHKILLEEKREQEYRIVKEEENLTNAVLKGNQLEENLKALESEMDETRKIIRDLERQSEDSEINQQILSIKSRIGEINKAIVHWEREIESIETLYNSLKDKYNHYDFKNELKALTDPEIPSLEKEKNLKELDKEATNLKQKYEEDKGVAKKEKEEIDEELKTLNDEIFKLKKNEQVYSKGAMNAIRLKQEINKKLESLNRKERAFFSSEMVVELLDESWRNALESYIGFDRYSILVEPSAYEIASDVQKSMKLHGARLINTKKLLKKEYNVHENSVLHNLKIENNIAYNYFAFLIGNVTEATPETAFEHTPSLCKNLYYTSNLFSDFKKQVEDNCLGYGATKINLIRKEAERDRLLKLRDKTQQRIATIESNVSDLAKLISLINKSYNFNAYKNLESENQKRSKTQQELKAAELSIQENNAYFEILERLSAYKKTQQELTRKKDALNREIGDIQRIQLTSKNKVEELEEGLRVKEVAIQAHESTYPEDAIVAEEEFKKFLENFKAGKTTKAHSYIPADELEKKVYATKVNLINIEKDYLKVYSSFVNFNFNEVNANEEEFKVFSDRLKVLEIDNIQKARIEVEKEQRNLNEIFKNEFVAEIFEAAEEAKLQLCNMNKALRKMNFSTEYQFITKYLQDGSDYETIIKYAKESQKHQDGQLNLFDFDAYNETDKTDEFAVLNQKMKAIIDKITSSETDRDVLKQLSDYRNYLTYDIKIKDKNSGQEGLLSKQVGYDSGAGVQIPYTIILAVSLCMEYDRDPDANTVRLMLLDEPLEKCSEENVKKVINLFQELNMQTIFCGASKLESIGANCQVILPVLKISKTCQTLGSIEMKNI